MLCYITVAPKQFLGFKTAALLIMAANFGLHNESKTASVGLHNGSNTSVGLHKGRNTKVFGYIRAAPHQVLCYITAATISLTSSHGYIAAHHCH